MKRSINAWSNDLCVSRLSLFVIAGLIGGLTSAAADAGPHWGYRVENGPATWQSLDKKFETCGKGQAQSPIDLPIKSAPGASDIVFDYRGGPANVVNNGHTIQVNVAKGNVLKIGARTYRLIQFHFHTPSENTVDGLHYPMETHLVHADDQGRLAVVALLVKSGATGVIDSVPRPAKKGETGTIDQINPSDLLPKEASHFAFAGSLTTPPCSEGVSWIVMRQPVEAASSTIAQFYSILGANNRPTNPLNGRTIVSSR
ncbi:MAG: carbonic anhydrase family protein [Filomicrobium sp.]